MPDIDPQELKSRPNICGAFEQGGTENPYAVMQDIQQCMEEHAGIVRNQRGLGVGWWC